MPKKLYTPEQRKEKQRERARNYQKKKTLRNRIVRYSCFLIQQGYTVIYDDDFEKLRNKGNTRKRTSLILIIILLVLLIAFIIK